MDTQIRPRPTPLPADVPPTAQTTCNGCFKPLDPATSYKRPVRVTASRYSRFSRGPATPPSVEHFCDIKCHQRAESAAHGNGGFRF